MSDELLVQAWQIQLPEPSTSDRVTRIRVQEEYLGAQLAPWLTASPPDWLRDLHSFHIMRYLDPDHLDSIAGIAVNLRFLGTTDSLGASEPEIRVRLDDHRKSGVLHAFETKAPGLWADSVLEEYGGPGIAEPFAQFLAASSILSLSLLCEPRHGFQDRVLVAEHWHHCFNLIVRGT